MLHALLLWQQFDWGARRLEDSALKTAAAQPELFDAFLGTPSPDRPDRAALADNPLVPFGGIDR